MSDLVAPRDRRLGETWTRTQTWKNDALYALAMVALGATGRLGARWRRRLGRLVGDVVWLGWPAGRALVARNLAVALPGSSVSARAVLRGLGETLADTVGLARGEAPGLVLRDDDARVLESAVAEGRGVVYATAHLGSWEAMGPLLAARGLAVATVARESYDARFDRVYSRLREAHGVRALYRGAPGFATALVRALRAGTVVGFPMDFAGRGVRAVPAAWFGVPLPTPVGPAEVALRTGAAVVVATPTRDPGGPETLSIERVATEGHDAGTLTSELARRLSRRIEAMPTAWPWMARDLAAGLPLALRSR